MSICNRILATQTGRYRIKILSTVTIESANNWISDNSSSTHLTHHEESSRGTEVCQQSGKVNKTQRGSHAESLRASWAQRFPPRGPPTNCPIVDSCYCLPRKTVMHPSPHPQTCYHFLSHFPAGANKLWNLRPAFMNEVKWQKRRPRSTCDRTWAALSLTICLRLYLTQLAHTHSTHTPTNRMEVRLDLKLTQKFACGLISRQWAINAHWQSWMFKKILCGK